MDWTTEFPRIVKLYMKVGRYGDRLLSAEDEKKYEVLINDFGAYSISVLLKSPQELIKIATDPVADAINVKKVTELKEVLFAALKLDDYPKGF